jgi:hypothetical protein
MTYKDCVHWLDDSFAGGSIEFDCDGIHIVRHCPVLQHCGCGYRISTLLYDDGDEI